MVLICPLTQADLTKITAEKLVKRLKATSTVSITTLQNTLRNKFGVEPKSQGMLALQTEYAEHAVAQASHSDRLPFPRPNNKRSSPASSQGAAKKARRAPSVSSEASPGSGFSEISLDESSYDASSVYETSPVPVPAPLRGTPVRAHASAVRNQSVRSTPQGPSSVKVNVASTGVRRVLSTGARRVLSDENSASPFSGAAQLPSSPPHPSRLDFDSKPGAGRSRLLSAGELAIVFAGALLAFGMTAFLDTGFGLQPYQAPASPQIDSVPTSVRNLGPKILSTMEWSCRSLRPWLDAEKVLARLNTTDVSQKEVSAVLNFYTRKGILMERSPDGILQVISRYSTANPCGVTHMCRLYRFLWLALPLLVAMVDIVLRFKHLLTSRLFATAILEELRHAAEMGRSLAAGRLREELVERLGITATSSGIDKAWRSGVETAFKDKRLHKFAQVDGGEQIEMWQFKSGTARSLSVLSYGSPGKSRSPSVATLFDMVSLGPRAAIYTFSIAGFYATMVQ